MNNSDVYYILTCQCGDTPQFAREAFKVLFPDREVPMVLQMNDIAVEQSNNPYIKALKKATDKFAFYYGPGGEVWDLLKGVRVA